MHLDGETIRNLREVDPALYSSIIGKLKEKAELSKPGDYVERLFPAQRRFFEDKSRKKAALCGRRSGKTEAVIAMLLEKGRENPGSLSVYIALTRNSARLIAWRTLLEIEQRHKLGLRFREKDQQLTCTLPNGSQIWISGCPHEPDKERYRGLKLVAAVIDEAGSFPESWFRELVFDVLEPSLLDYNGVLVMIGTPAIVPVGLFFEITTGEGGVGRDRARQWSTHSWMCYQNPYIQHFDKEREAELERSFSSDMAYVNKKAEDWVEELRMSNGWDKQHPRFIREWQGQWVKDNAATVYPFDQKRNYFYTLPTPQDGEQWRYAIGIDVGYEDDTAFVVGAYCRGTTDIFLVHSESRKHMIPSAVAARAQALKKQFGANRMIVDSGGIGAAYAEEAKQRYGVNFEKADKTKKRAYQELVRGEILSGTIKIHPVRCEALMREAEALLWNEDMSDQADGLPDHMCDAMLYLCRALQPHYRGEVEPRRRTHKEEILHQQTEAKKAALKAVQVKLRKKMKNRSVFREIASPVHGYR